jgi:diguanylate cyclase (GGDEF)-like protein
MAARRAPADAGGAGLSTLAGRLGVGFLVAAGCMFLTVDRRAGIEVALALGHMTIVAVASWRLSPAWRWATVGLATARWSAAQLTAGGAPVTGAPVGVWVSHERDSARRDRLTRLWNSRYLHEALEREIYRCRRYGRPFGLLILDLDGFKAVNDTAGHEAGDRVLQTVGHLIRESCRTTDTPARLGGDEFVVSLPEASRLTVPRYTLKLVDLIARAPFPTGLPRVSASIGAVAFEHAPESVGAALAAADDAMYAAKRDGKNFRVAVHDVGGP